MLVAPSIYLHSLLGKVDRFDLTLIGLTHTLFFLLALARLLYVTRALRAWPVVWGLTLLVVTDVGYTAYWNSLYTEPASFIWFLFLLSEAIGFCISSRITAGAAARFSIFAVLLITAKTQNAPLGISLGAYLVWMALRSTQRVQLVSFAGAAAMAVAGIAMYSSLLPAPRVISLYNVVFYAILPDSPDPEADLNALGLNREYVRYSGTLPWSEGTGVVDGALVKSLLEKMTPFKLAAFYLSRPNRMLRHVRMRLPAYFSLRPEFCGNFEASAGKAPGAKSRALALWSSVHERVLAPAGLLILAALPLSVIAGGVFTLRARRSPAGERGWVELGTCLAACCFLAFFVAAFGDSHDNTKHQFLFNLLLDSCLVFVAATAAARLMYRRGARIIFRRSLKNLESEREACCTQIGDTTKSLHRSYFYHPLVVRSHRMCLVRREICPKGIEDYRAVAMGATLRRTGRPRVGQGRAWYRGLRRYLSSRPDSKELPDSSGNVGAQLDQEVGLPAHPTHATPYRDFSQSPPP